MAAFRAIGRRGFLAGAGSAIALGALGCRRTPGLRLPPAGEIVGPSDRRGHALRDGQRPAVPGATLRCKVLVVGGGVAGLGAAWRLDAGGLHDVLVCELEDSVGGTARPGLVAGQPCPWGAHYVAAPRAQDRALVRLLAELGALDAETPEPVVREELLVREPEERLYHAGFWSEGLYRHAGATADDRGQLARFEQEIAGWVAFRDGQGRRAFDLPVARSGDDPRLRELDAQSMAAWMDARGFTSERLRWLVDYACRDDYGATPAQVSAWAGLFYFASRVAAPGQESAPLVTWPEGNGRLVRHLAGKLGPQRLRSGTTVLELKEQRALAVDAHGQPLTIDFEHAILCVPRFIARRIFPPAGDNPFTYGSWLVANLALSDRPRQRTRGIPLAWDNVLHDAAGLGYVVATHQQGKDTGPTVFTYYRPFCEDGARQQLLEHDWAFWARQVLEDLLPAHPDLPELCTRMDLVRWGHAMVRPTPGLLFGGARQAAMQPIGKVHFAHTELSGLALFEEALDHGLRAAEEILGGESWR